MIQKTGKFAKAMEFTSIDKKEGVTDDELIQSAMQFEQLFLQQFDGILFHCLVRNLNGSYANVLLADDKTTLEELSKHINGNEVVQNFFDKIDNDSVKMSFSKIEKEGVTPPVNFSCVEYGTFALKDASTVEQLLESSKQIETHYLAQNDNTKAHFISTINENLFAEVTFGATLGKTKEVCMGYLENEQCKPMLALADADSMELDFWMLVA